MLIKYIVSDLDGSLYIYYYPNYSLKHTNIMKLLYLLSWKDLINVVMFIFEGLATLINRLNKQDMTIAVDGSLYRFHPRFHNLMCLKIKELVKPGLKVSIFFKAVFVFTFVHINIIYVLAYVFIYGTACFIC